MTLFRAKPRPRWRRSKPLVRLPLGELMRRELLRIRDEKEYAAWRERERVKE